MCAWIAVVLLLARLIDSWCRHADLEGMSSGQEWNLASYEAQYLKRAEAVSQVDHHPLLRATTLPTALDL